MLDDTIWEIIQGHDIEQSQDWDKFSNLFAIGPYMLLDVMAAHR